MGIKSMIQQGIHRGIVTTKAHTPEILMALGTGAFAGTVVMAVKATPTANRKLEKAEYECLGIQGKPRRILHICKEVAPVYAPTALMGAAALACFFGAHHIHVKRQVALASAYSMVSNTLNKYQDRVIDKFGEDTHKAINDKAMREEEPIEDVEYNVDAYEGEGDTLVWDKVTGRRFRSNPARIREAESYILKRLVDDLTVPLNRFYEELELEDSYLGDAIGWDVQSEKPDISFHSAVDKYGRPWLVLSYRTVVVEPGLLRSM